MLDPQKMFLRVTSRTVGALALVLAASCALTDDEDDGSDSNGSPGGVAGQGISLAGAPQGGSGNSTSGGGSNNAGTTGTSACENLMVGECGGSSIEANFKTVNILLVIDKSGSMDDTPEGFDVNKWMALKEALDAALTASALNINFGLLLYPFSRIATIPLDNCGARCCDVPPGLQAINVNVGPGLDTLPRILSELDATSPGGGTPTSAALAGAYEYFTVGEGAILEGERYVLLATDGGPNCNGALSCGADRCTTNMDGACTSVNCCEGARLSDRCLDDEAVKSQVEALAGEGINTFVVGIPGTEQYSTYLDAIAAVSGVPNPNGPDQYYRVDAAGGVGGLVKVFTTITTQLVRGCDIELASRPLNPALVNVYIDCNLIPKGEDNNLSWEVDASAEAPMIHLQGSICNQVENRGAERVDVTFGCPSVR